MDSKEFAKSMVAQVTAFCATYEGKPPAYSYVPLADDAARVKVMKSRLWNEVRAAEVLGSWLKGISQLGVKSALGGAIQEEFEHAELLSGVLRGRQQHLVTVACLQDRVPLLMKYAGDHPPYRWLVLRKKHYLITLWEVFGDIPQRRYDGVLLDSRQIYPESRPSARFTINGNVTSVLLHNPVAGG